MPVLHGSEGIGITELRDAVTDAKRLGFPVLIKAAAGGGGKGMRVVRDESELARLFPLARAESEAALARARCISKNILSVPGTSNFRFSPTTAATPFILANATAHPAPPSKGPRRVAMPDHDQALARQDGQSGGRAAKVAAIPTLAPSNFSSLTRRVLFH